MVLLMMTPVPTATCTGAAISSGGVISIPGITCLMQESYLIELHPDNNKDSNSILFISYRSSQSRYLVYYA
tara:strand:- start:2111 stop:2323 length:213 start_codon:yes stop_codon:yes gene_type:complete